jgi:hypothetical protein
MQRTKKLKKDKLYCIHSLEYAVRDLLVNRVAVVYDLDYSFCISFRLGSCFLYTVVIIECNPFWEFIILGTKTTGDLIRECIPGIIS